ncbi:hypothetical protein B484DRAFT_444095, partial [Ochromonadaceae sp. CCMP2298]
IVPQYHVLTVSHAVAPWRWPQLYPDEWLQAVTAEHTHYTLELRHEDGVFVHQADLWPRAFHHASRDMALLHLEDEANTAELFRKMGVELGGCELANTNSAHYPLRDGQKLQFHGHEVTRPLGDSFFDPLGTSAGGAGGEGLDGGVAGGSLGAYSEAEDDRLCIPRIIAGTVQGRTQKQIFASTLPLVLPDGMCGGPVCIPRPSVSGTSGVGAGGGGGGGKRRGVPVSAVSNAKGMGSGKFRGTAEMGLGGSGSGEGSGDGEAPGLLVVCGLVEGIVPAEHPVVELRGSAVFVEGPEIHSFIADVEAGIAQPLMGGQAASFVGADQDEAKMDILKVL